MLHEEVFAVRRKPQATTINKMCVGKR